MVEIVFSYPGLGTLTLNAIQNRDYFLIQGIFLFLIIGVLIANFIIDIAYVFIDPRTRDRDAGRRVMAVSDQRDVVVTTGAPAPSLETTATTAPGGGAPIAPAGVRGRSEFVHFALRNWKFVVGPRPRARASSCSRSSARCSTDDAPLAFSGPTDQPPSSEYWFGTTSFGQNVFSQFVYGLRAAFLVGVVGGGIAWILGATIGFTAGYRGGWIDDVLNMLTNVVLVIPTLAILIIVAAYMNVQSYATEAILIGLTSWPWAARAVRAQTFSLKTRDFVDVARLSGRGTRQIITTEIAPNMSSYLLMMFILLFGGRDPHRRVPRLPRARALRVHLARPDDEQRVSLERATPRPVVVVRTAGHRDHRHRRRPLRDERRPRRDLQPEAAGEVR